MTGLMNLGLTVVVALSFTHDPHGCPEPAHDHYADCRCALSASTYGGFSYYQPRPYVYRRPAYHPRPYPVPTYREPYFSPPPPRYVVTGRPVREPGPVLYVDGPPIYVDAPPVYVEPAQIYIERPEIIVRPSEVITAPPEVHFEPCPEGAACYQAPAQEVSGAP